MEEQKKQEKEVKKEAPEKQEKQKKQKKPQKPKKGRKNSKKTLVLIIICLGLALATAAAYLVLLTSPDRRFCRAVERGVQNGWKVKGAEANLRRTDRTNDTSFIDAEYEAVCQYKDVKFRSRKLGKLAKEYIAALEDCREVIATTSPDMDFNGFWRKFSDPYGQRISALYGMQKRGMGFDLRRAGHEEECSELLLQGWAIEKASKIKFRIKKGEDGERLFVAKVKNDSGYDLAYLDLTVELYGKDSKLLETDSAYAEYIKKGGTAKMVFYEAGESKAVDYAVTAVSCSRISPQELAKATSGRKNRNNMRE